MCGYFVAGAPSPSVITENVAQDKGLVNGTKCEMHSLTLTSNSSQLELLDVLHPELVTMQRGCVRLGRDRARAPRPPPLLSPPRPTFLTFLDHLAVRQIWLLRCGGSSVHVQIVRG